MSLLISVNNMAFNNGVPGKVYDSHQRGRDEVINTPHGSEATVIDRRLEVESAVCEETFRGRGRRRHLHGRRRRSNITGRAGEHAVGAETRDCGRATRLIPRGAATAGEHGRGADDVC